MLKYPALFELATQTLHSLGVSESFLVGRNETADICVFDRTCSRHHFRIVRRDGCHYVTVCRWAPQKRNCPDQEVVRDLLRWMTLCYIGTRGGTTRYGNIRPVFYSGTAAGPIERRLTGIGENQVTMPTGRTGTADSVKL